MEALVLKRRTRQTLLRAIVTVFTVVSGPSAHAARVIPDTDPVVTEPVPGLVPQLEGRHPRLLFSAADAAELNTFRSTPDGLRLWNVVHGYRSAALQPGNTQFLSDATEAQRKGFWRMPTKALYYALTGDAQRRRELIDYMEFLLSLEHWEVGSETDAGMGAANMMVGAALAYDVLYHELEPNFRDSFRRKLWLQARRMYYGGHLQYLDNSHYWQGDPQNNHRWHRNAGLTLCVLAAWTGAEDQKWLMRELQQELTTMARWLPPDGTSHEGPGYEVFGASHLTVALDAADRCLGTQHLQEPFFANCTRYLIQTHLPGYEHWFNYGDQSGIDAVKWGYHVFQLKAASVFADPDTVSMLDTLMDRHGVDSIAAWAGFLWYPRDLEKGYTGHLPTTGFFSDLGLCYMRSTWDAGGKAAMFKCGPLGGYTLNRYRVENGMKYINVAHDDPDTNTFILYGDDSYLAETDRYSYKKQTAALNGLLINGIGAVAAGRNEGLQWSQPATQGRDMTRMGVITAYAENDRAVALEGQAAGAYPAHSQSGKSRPAMDSMRRVFLWVRDRYVLVLDTVRGPQPVDVTWLMQGRELDALDAAAGHYQLAGEFGVCPFQVVAEFPGVGSIDTSPAEQRGKPLGWEQLRLQVPEVAAVRLVSAYDLWNHGDLSVSLLTEGPDLSTVTVRAAGSEDRWSWQTGRERFDPSQVTGFDSRGFEIIDMHEPEPQTRTLIFDIAGEPESDAGRSQSR
jgi:hypothetical protein